MSRSAMAGALIAFCGSVALAAGPESESDVAYFNRVWSEAAEVRAQSLKLHEAAARPVFYPNLPSFTVEQRGDVSYVYSGAGPLPALGEGVRGEPDFAVVRQGEAYFIWGNGRASQGGDIGSRGVAIGFKEKVSRR